MRLVLSLLLLVFAVLPAAAREAMMWEGLYNEAGIGFLDLKQNTKQAVFTYASMDATQPSSAIMPIELPRQTLWDLKMDSTYSPRKKTLIGVSYEEVGVVVHAYENGWARVGFDLVKETPELKFVSWRDFFAQEEIVHTLESVPLYANTHIPPEKYGQSKRSTLQKNDAYSYNTWKDKAPYGLHILRIEGDWALVLIDLKDSYSVMCNGDPSAQIPPEGPIGWVRLFTPQGAPLVREAYPKGC